MSLLILVIGSHIFGLIFYSTRGFPGGSLVKIFLNIYGYIYIRKDIYFTISKCLPTHIDLLIYSSSLKFPMCFKIKKKNNSQSIFWLGFILQYRNRAEMKSCKQKLFLSCYFLSLSLSLSHTHTHTHTHTKTNLWLRIICIYVIYQHIFPFINKFPMYFMLAFYFNGISQSLFSDELYTEFQSYLQSLPF